MGNVTVGKVWQSGLWWPMVGRDAAAFGKTWDMFQRTGQSSSNARISSGRSYQLLHKQETGTFSWPPITAEMC